jgi:hypothetical protein
MIKKVNFNNSLLFDKLKTLLQKIISN